MLAMVQEFQKRQRVLHQVKLEGLRVEVQDGQPILRKHARLPALWETFFNKPCAEVVQPVSRSTTTISVTAIERK